MTEINLQSCGVPGCKENGPNLRHERPLRSSDQKALGNAEDEIAVLRWADKLPFRLVNEGKTWRSWVIGEKR